MGTLCLQPHQTKCEGLTVQFLSLLLLKHCKIVTMSVCLSVSWWRTSRRLTRAGTRPLKSWRRPNINWRMRWQWKGNWKTRYTNTHTLGLMQEYLCIFVLTFSVRLSPSSVPTNSFNCTVCLVSNWWIQPYEEECVCETHVCGKAYSQKYHTKVTITVRNQQTKGQFILHVPVLVSMT